MSEIESVLPYLLRQRAHEIPEQTFVSEVDGASKTFSQVYEAMCRWSGVLRELGVEQGHYVAAMLPNCIETVNVWFGINALGAVEVPIHADYRGRLLAHVLNISRARVAVISERYLDRLADVAASLEHLEVVVVPELCGDVSLPFKTLSGADLLGKAKPVTPVEGIRANELCTVLFTSGTTGASKGVMVPYAQLRASTEGAWPMDDMGSGDVYYSMLPAYHISGKIAVDSMLTVGGQVLLRERFKTDAFWDDVRSYGATCACIMGAMAAFLMGLSPSPDDPDTTLAKVLMLPLPPYLDEFMRRFGVRVHTIFNQTEISCPITSVGWDVGDGVSCGRQRPGYACRIVDENDEDVSVGTVGELVVRAERPWTLMAGYLGMPEKTVETTRNQWLHTGDAFKMGPDGSFYFVDRLKDVIRRRGENISSVEVEEAVCEHPAVLECAAVPVPSKWTEEEVKIIVVCSDGADVDAPSLMSHLESRLPHFMVPRYVEFVDALPKTPTQKVRKAVLREHGVTPGTWDRQQASDVAPTTTTTDQEAVR